MLPRQFRGVHLVIVTAAMIGLGASAASGRHMGACCLTDDTCTMMFDEAQCLAEGGEYHGDGTTCMQAECHGGHHPCDFDGDGCVSVNDMIMMMVGWGACSDPPNSCQTDVDSSGTVDVGDLVILITSWGCG
ncbi:MAG: hypothetical protein ACYTF9_09560 [Planctomycetota bacterium]